MACTMQYHFFEETQLEFIFIESTIYIHISEHSHMVEVTIDGWSYYELRYRIKYIVLYLIVCI